jgi:HPt (histidine-containing phosphotransfer) domain-containing protein
MSERGDGTRVAAEAMPVDVETALAYADGDADLLMELLGEFAADCPARVRELRAGLAGGDAGALALASHSLKGALRVIAAGPAAELAQELESLGAAGDVTAAGPVLERLDRELGRIGRFIADGDAVARAARGIAAGEDPRR